VKDYPHILNCSGQSFRAVSGAHVFDKLDGNNIRAEYSRKQNWHKFGTRTQRIDHTDKVLGGVLAVFMAQQSEALTKMARDERCERVTVFGEYYGEKSFVGIHQPDAEDPKKYTVFDISPYPQDVILGPKQFLKLAEKYHFDTPRYHGQFNWTRGFMTEVWEGRVDCAFEGVVGKAAERDELILVKAKTKGWIEKVRAQYTPEEAEKIINS
jgi:hypothetical protein